MTREIKTPEEIEEIFRGRFGDGISEITIKGHAEGRSKKMTYSIWVYLKRALLKDAVGLVKEIDYPHLSVISGVDCGDHIDLLYQMSVFYGIRDAEIKLALVVPVPKDDLKIPSIADLIPGAGYGEREKQDMLGIEVTDIPDGRRLFLPEDFPDGVYPWRKDETGISGDRIKELYKVGRPTGRAVPDVKPKEKKKPVNKTGEAVKPAAEKPESEVKKNE